MNVRHTKTDIGTFGGVTSFVTATDLRDNVNTVIATDRYTTGNWLNQATISYQGYQRNPTPTNPDIISRSYFDDAVCCTFIGQIGGAQSSQDYNQDRLSLRNDVTYSGWQWAGRHVVKAGANIDFARYHVNKDNNGNPLFTYFASDSFNFPHQATLGAGNPLFTTTKHEIGAFLQDDWSPTSRLQAESRHPVGLRIRHDRQQLRHAILRSLRPSIRWCQRTTSPTGRSGPRSAAPSNRASDSRTPSMRPVARRCSTLLRRALLPRPVRQRLGNRAVQ